MDGMGSQAACDRGRYVRIIIDAQDPRPLR
jgi:hypothetical protein